MIKNIGIAPAKVERDVYGFWEHPVLFEFHEDATFKDIKEKYNVEISYTNFEYDAPEELWDEYYDSCDARVIAKWEPTPPSGGVEGWYMLSIHCVEDGDIYCVWYKNLELMLGVY